MPHYPVLGEQLNSSRKSSDTLCHYDELVRTVGSLSEVTSIIDLREKFFFESFGYQELEDHA